METEADLESLPPSTFLGETCVSDNCSSIWPVAHDLSDILAQAFSNLLFLLLSFLFLFALDLNLAYLFSWNFLFWTWNYSLFVVSLKKLPLNSYVLHASCSSMGFMLFSLCSVFTLASCVYSRDKMSDVLKLTEEKLSQIRDLLQYLRTISTETRHLTQ